VTQPKISPFSVSDHLESEEMIKAYLKAVREESDPELLQRALQDAETARARLVRGTDVPPASK
jgi:DNA-binding phage protein